MEEKQILFNDVARRAVAEYDMKGYPLMFIRHSDNVTFKVEGPGLGAYLLRIHVPVTRAMGAHGADSSAVNSELLWLEALSQDTDLVLQKPVRNRAGALVTQVPAENVALPVNCTLMHWVDGQPYHRDLESEQTAYRIGEILAKLHIHASYESPSKRQFAVVYECAYNSFMDYQWDDNKAKANLKKHKVDFADAVTVFSDDLAITIEDADPDEERFVTIGIDALGRILVVVYTWRGESIRLISARKATKDERREYYEEG